MDILVALLVFTAAMLGCIITDTTMVAGLFVGYLAFFAVGLHRKVSARSLLDMSRDGIKDVLLVMYIMLTIGVLTATWRMSGTILYFVYYGVKLITPRIFLVAAFLLTCLVSYALGTSFGVSATVGVILMAIARSGGIHPALATGAIFSGVYFGDRGSPVSSAATVVAALTETDMYGNVKLMHKTAALPFALTTLIYAVLSWFHPIQAIDPAMLQAIETDFILSHSLLIPFIIMLVLPLLRVPIWVSCSLSIAAAGAISVFVQGMPLSEVIHACIFGYQPTSGALGDLLSGGGAASMLEVVVILIISCTYSKIFEGTGMLEDISVIFDKSVQKVGLFGTSLWLSIATVAIFCNQTIGSIVTITLLRETYRKHGATNREMAMDMQNSVILIGGMVPWSIACTVPLGFMGADPSAVPYAFFFWLVPICYALTKKKFDFSK